MKSVKHKIIGYGELLLRLTPSQHGELIEQSHSLGMSFAGAEANVLADLSNLGHRTQFVSSFPENPIGRKASQFLKQYGIDIQELSWDDKRLGTYFIEHGRSIRGTRVTYDRKNSSVCHHIISKEKWYEIFKDAGYFILTGVTPALSYICRQNILSALQSAKENDVTIVFDLNYRRSLWSGEEAREAFLKILPFVDILIGNVGSAKDVFNISIDKWTDYEDLCAATLTSVKGLQDLGDFDAIAMTMRIQKSASHNLLGGMIVNRETNAYSDLINVDIVDRIGGGDAFTAGIIHGIIRNWEYSQTVKFANACYAATHTLLGDINQFTESELQNIAQGELKGFTKR